jgi:hypothetical protein
MSTNTFSLKSNPRILFYTNNLRAFRSYLIGYLYEISQVYPVVLLSEKLDSKTEELINDKILFPKLEEVVPIGQYNEEKGFWKKNAFLCRSAKMFVKKYKPDVVIAIGNFFFESYLRRFAAEKGALTINCIGPLLFLDIKDFIAYRMALSVYSSTPSFLPLFIRKAFIKIKKILGQFFYYWILPLSVGQGPFIGAPSSIFWWDFSRAKGADYFFVFSKRDKDFLISHGMPSDKVIILLHSLEGAGRKLVKEVYLKSNFKQEKNKAKIITIMWPLLPVMFPRGDGYKIISEKDTEDFRIKNVKMIAETLKGWRIFIKPHPMIKSSPEQLERIIKVFEPISDMIKVVDPDESAEEYIEISNVILGFQPACMTLFSASLQTPEKPIFALDLKAELLGDFYRGSDRVQYIDSKEKLMDILQQIRDNKFVKNYQTNKTEEGYYSIVEMLKNIC